MKKSLLLCLTLSISLWVQAQATDLVVDCQTPGWLSSMINYGDQQTVKNLKVTGYINDVDLSFIGTLASNQTLNGIIDLGEVCIVGNGSTTDNYFDGTKILDLFYNRTKALSLVKFVCPKGATTAINAGAGFEYIDTLIYDCAISEFGQEYIAIDRKINHLIIGERTIKINDNAFKYNLINSIHFPSSLQTIGDGALMGVLEDLSKTNINIFPSLEKIGKLVFVNDNNTIPLVPSNKGTLPDTIKLPQIRNFNITAFDYKENIHIYLGDSLKRMSYRPDIRNDNIYWEPNLNNVFFHLRTSTPPSFDFEMLGLKRLIPYGLTLCIPKGSKDAYEEILNKYSSAIPHYYTLIEEDILLEQIILHPSELTMEIGDIITISATLLPESATEKTLVWSVGNNNIATVSQSGEVTALSSGETIVYASSVDGSIQDSCKITVKAHAESVSIEPATAILSQIGDVAQLTATVLPATAVDKSVTWKSSNEAICTVSDQGLVTAIGIGSTVVTATTVDGGLTATCVVKVIQHVSSISLNQTTLSLKVGETDKLQATISPENADNKVVKWSTSNEQLATVDEEGNVEALKAGEVWITATSDDNPEIKASCKVTITQPVTDISLSQTNIELTNIGESVQLEATITPEDASDKSVTWKSNNEQVCIVSSTGMVTAIGAGTTVVTATTNDGGKMAFCIVNVTLQEYNITLDQYTMTLNVGETAQLHATVSGNTNKTINWSSSNDQIVTVDNNGNITAIKVGNALIYATLAEHSDVQTSCAVTVREVDGILEISGNSIDTSSVYDVTGRQVQKLKKGLNIIRKKDGTIRKVMIK